MTAPARSLGFEGSGRRFKAAAGGQEHASCLVARRCAYRPGVGAGMEWLRVGGGGWGVGGEGLGSTRISGFRI